MYGSAVNFWIALGLILVLAEMLLPGLISVFLGLGALSVAGMLYLGLIDSVAAQLLTWFASSTVYLFTLRALFLRIYPSDTEKQDIDEVHAAIGSSASVVEDIPTGGIGRISYGQTTWKATTRNHGEIRAGSTVRIIGRDNITWIVEKISEKES